MKADTARKLFNRLNSNLTDTLDALSFLGTMITEVQTERDYNITTGEIALLENKKKDLLIEMSKLQKSF